MVIENVHCGPFGCAMNGQIRAASVMIDADLPVPRAISGHIRGAGARGVDARTDFAFGSTRAIALASPRPCATNRDSKSRTATNGVAMPKLVTFPDKGLLPMLAPRRPSAVLSRHRPDRALIVLASNVLVHCTAVQYWGPAGLSEPSAAFNLSLRPSLVHGYGEPPFRARRARGVVV